MTENVTGPVMFADLTSDELDIAIAKLRSGATAAVKVTSAHAFHSEMHAVLMDMHAAWDDRFAAERRGSLR